MTFVSFDPRKAIREKIGTAYHVNNAWNATYTIDVTDIDGDTVYVPIYLSEEIKIESLKEMPLVSMHMVHAHYDPMNVAGDVRKKTCYIDIGVWFANTDEVDNTAFGKKISNWLQNKIRLNQSCSITGIDFMNIEDVRCLEEREARQVTHHIVITVKCIVYDLTT